MFQTLFVFVLFGILFGVEEENFGGIKNLVEFMWFVYIFQNLFEFGFEFFKYLNID